MNDVKERRTGVLHLGNAVSLPCDATKNESFTFDIPVIAKIGDKVFSIAKLYNIARWKSRQDFLKAIVQPSDSFIEEITACEIAYATGCGVSVAGYNQKGERVGYSQQLLYSTYEEAKKGVIDLSNFYIKHFGSDWIDETSADKRCSYMLKFDAKPQQLLKKNDVFCKVNRVIAKVSQSVTTVTYQGIDCGVSDVYQPKCTEVKYFNSSCRMEVM